MSKIGKLMRGLGWHNSSNLDGVYHKDVAEDPNKMDEVNFYLDFVKVRDAKKVHKLFLKYRTLDLSNPPNKNSKMQDVAVELESLSVKAGKK